jgi:protein-tyrosine phosphatase
VFYAVVFLLLAAYLVFAAAELDGWGWLLLWPAAAFAAAGVAYAGLGPCVFGKRPDGRLRVVNTSVLLPFLLLTWGTWHVHRRLTREPAWDEVAPGLYLGRRPLAGGLPDGVVMVVDLTAEFVALRPVRDGRTYLSLPALDAGAPDFGRFRTAVDAAARAEGPVFVHCANGRGRSALFAAAVLVAKGLAGGADEAVKLIKKARPRVRLKPPQVRMLRRFVAGRG